MGGWRDRLPRVDVPKGLRLVVGWHVVGAVASLVALLAALSPSGELPGAVRTVLIVFWGAAFAGNAAGAVGLAGKRAKEWARTVSLVTSYLVFVVCAVAYAHRIGVFTGLNSFADGFQRGILAVPVVALGLWWVAAARGIARRKPGAGEGAARTLRIAGLAIAVVGAVVFLALVDLPGGLLHMLRRTAQPWTLGALVVGLLAWLAFRFVWSPRVGDHFGTPRSRQEALTGLLFLSPNILGFTAFFAGPLLFSLVISFFDWDAFGGTREFVGVDNYIKILSLQFVSGSGDALAGDVLKPGYQELMRLDWFGADLLVGARDILFWTSLRNILIFLVLAVPLSVFPALVLSTILNSKLRGMRFFRAVYFIPSVAGVIGITIIWGQLFSSTVGWINYLRTRFNDIFSFLPFIDAPEQPFQTPWLSDTSTALISIVIVFAWMTFGFNTILYLAGHQGISPDLYEAAELDGANSWQRFKRITVPQLRSTTFYVVATTSILAMQQFDIVFVLTNPPGGPSNSTLTPVLHLYNEGFQSSRHGYASAVAWVLFLMIFGLTIAQFRRQRETV